MKFKWMAVSLALLLSGVGPALGTELTDAAKVLAGARWLDMKGHSDEQVRFTVTSRTGEARTFVYRMRTRRDGQQIAIRGDALDEKSAIPRFLILDDRAGGGEIAAFVSALKRVVTLQPKKWGKAFQKSDFSYEDLVFVELGRAVHAMKSSEGGRVVVRSEPPGESTAYRYLETVVQGSDGQRQTAEMYSREGALVKRLTVQRFASAADGGFPVATLIEDLQSGSQTLMEVVEHKIHLPAEAFPAELFTRDGLKTAL